MSELPGSAAARQMLDALRDEHSQEPRLGCELNAHRDLGFCACCANVESIDELIGWRLLAIVERGVAHQSE